MCGSQRPQASASRSCSTTSARMVRSPISTSRGRCSSMNKRGLGRGLGALLSSTPTVEDVLIEVAIDQIEANPNQPRKEFDFKSLDELAASIKASGVIQPVIVRREGTGYQLIAGERRWRAARQAGLDRIPAIVRDATDAQSLELALVENLLREDLNPIEEAEAYQKLLSQFGWTQEELAGRIGRDRSSIANALRLLRLPDEIQADLRSGRLTMGHARALLAEQGYDVVGVTMRVWPWAEPSDATKRFGSCCGTEAVDDARHVARRLGIPYYLLNMEAEFERAVVARFADEYRRGRTPVPCVACNSELKFGSLLARARAWDAVAVATGHYARVARNPASGRHVLLRARDAEKDQTDFLWPLTQAQLAAARFPVGELTKAEVRAHARQLGLVTADKPESQEICFVPDDDYRGFLRRRDAAIFRPGPIVDREGKVLGRHEGVAAYTIGQRRGLGLAAGHALHVVDGDG